MEPSDKQLLIERVIQALILLCVIATLIWLLPHWISQWTSPAPAPKKHTKRDFDIRHFLSKEPHNEDIYNNIHFITYLLPNPTEYATTLHEQLDKEGIENYLLSVDNLDRELYIYQQGDLSHRILFIQEMDDISIPAGIKPMIAVVIGGLGETNNHNIINHTTPLSLAFVPSAPFTLPMAYEGAKHFHEILIDLRQTPDLKHPEQIIPFLSGTLTHEALATPLPQFVSVYPFSGKKDASIHHLPLYTRNHIDLKTVLLRAKKSAVQNGFCGILIEATDPNLDLLLEWTRTAKKEGIQLVMVSELQYRSPTTKTQAPTTPAQ